MVDLDWDVAVKYSDFLAVAARAKAFLRIEAGLREREGEVEGVAIKNRRGGLIILEGRVDV